MSRPSQTPASPVDFKVNLRNNQGQYLAQDEHGLYFCDQRQRALLLSFYADDVETQLELLRQKTHVTLEAVPVPLEEIYETCDRCHDLLHPTMVFFDGRRFLCEDCRKLFSRPKPRPSR